MDKETLEAIRHLVGLGLVEIIDNGDEFKLVPTELGLQQAKIIEQQRVVN